MPTTITGTTLTTSAVTGSNVTSATGENLVLKRAGVDSLTITTTGVGVGTSTPASKFDVAGSITCDDAGTGLKLPSSPTNGDKNTLDSYEEGGAGVTGADWTPTVTFGTGGSVSCTIDNARYVRVGKLVSFVLQVSYTVASAPTGGDLTFNVPFASSFNQYFGTGNFISLGGGTAQGPLYLALGASTNCTVRKASATGGLQIASQITTSSTFIVTGTYFT